MNLVIRLPLSSFELALLQLISSKFSFLCFIFQDSSTRIAKKMKSKFSKAWISFLRLPLPIDVYKEVQVTSFCVFMCVLDLPRY